MAVIMLTGHGSEQAARDGMRFGAYDYLTKPRDFEDLLTKINEAQGQRGQPTKGSVHDGREDISTT